MMSIRKTVALAVAVLSLLLSTGGAQAEILVPARPAPAPAPAPAPKPLPAKNLVLTGTLTYVTNLETPHYELDGWAVVVPDQPVLSLLAGQTVTVTGRPMDGVSILMRRQLAVSQMTAVLEGDLQVVDGHHELNGWLIRGLEADVQSLAGSSVRLVGSVVWREKGPPTMEALGIIPLGTPGVRQVAGPLVNDTEMRFRVGDWLLRFAYPQWLLPLVGRDVAVTGTPVPGAEQPTLQVTDLQVSLTGKLVRVANLESPHWELNGFVLTEIQTDLTAYAGRPVKIDASVSQDLSLYMKPALKLLRISSPDLPKQVVTVGQAPLLPVLPTWRDGYLMLPLRAVVEAAGGTVLWDQQLYAVRVTLADRTTTVRIGSRTTGDGVLPVAPFLLNGFTMAPLELFEQLGLRQKWGDAALYLE